MANKFLKELTIDGVTYDVPILGIKGQQETAFRTGDVNISPNDMLYLGLNITGGVANDTKAFWQSKTSGYAYFDAFGQIVDQPERYGYLVHTTTNKGSAVQTFYTLDGARVYQRSYSGAATAISAWKRLDSVAYDEGNGNEITFQYSGNTVNGAYVAGWNGYKVIAMDKAIATTDEKKADAAWIASTAWVQKAITGRLPETEENTRVSNVSTTTSAYTTYYFRPPSDSKGMYIGVIGIQWQANSSGTRYAQIMKNTTALAGSSVLDQASTSFGIEQCIPIVGVLNTGDELSIRLWQNCGSDLDAIVTLGNCYFIPFYN